MSNKLTREQLSAEKLLTREQVSRAFHYHPQTLRRWEIDGLGPEHLRLGGIVVYRQEDVELWVRIRLETVSKSSEGTEFKRWEVVGAGRPLPAHDQKLTALQGDQTQSARTEEELHGI